MHLSIYLCICLSIYAFVYLSVIMHLSIYLCICLSINAFVYLSMHLSIYLCICLSVYAFVYLSIYLSVCLSIYLSIYIYIIPKSLSVLDAFPSAIHGNPQRGLVRTRRNCMAWARSIRRRYIARVVRNGREELIVGCGSHFRHVVYHMFIIYWLVWNMTFMTFHRLGIIIPTDFHIFQRGRSTTNQYIYITHVIPCTYIYI